MVKISSFGSVLQITFAFNAFVSYIQEAKERGSREIAGILQTAIQEYDIKRGDPLYSQKLALELRVSRAHKRLAYISTGMSTLTMLSSISSLGLLISGGFWPDATVTALRMWGILGCLLGLPLLTWTTMHLSANAFRRSLSQEIECLLPGWEAAGLSKEKLIRIGVLAKQFRGLQVHAYRSGSFWLKVWALICDAWAKLRGHTVIPIDGEAAEKLLSMSKETGEDASTVAASALAFLKFIAERQDSYTVIHDKHGTELKRVLNRDLLASVKSGKNPFEE